MSEKVNVLIVEDNPGDAFIIQEYLLDDPIDQYDFTIAESLKGALQAIKNNSFNLIILDLNLPDSNGLETVKEIVNQQTKAAIVVITGLDRIQSGIQSVEIGVQDYLVKNKLNEQLLQRVVKYAITRKKDQNKLKHLYRVLHSIRNINQLITKAETEQTLISNACQLLVESNEYFNSWIILYDKKKRITNKASNGFNENIEKLFIDFNNGKYPGCIKNTFESNEIIVNENNEEFCTNLNSKNQQQSAILSRQLSHKNIVFGVIGVAVPIEYANNMEEHALFRELTDDISFALYTISQEYKKHKLNKQYHEQQKKLNALINNIPGIAFRCINDENWTMEYLSKACKKITGFIPEDFINNKHISYEEIIHPDDREKIRNSIDVQLKKFGHYSIEYRIITKSGDEKWVWEHGIPIYNAKKDITHLDGYISDITEQIDNTKALLESENRFRALYENSPDMYVSVSPESSKIILCNQTILNTLGYSQEEIINQPIFNLYHKDCLDEAHNVFKKFQKEGKVRNRELKLLKKDKSFIHVSLNIEAVRDHEGNILYSMSSFRDITEKKKAEKKLKEQNDKILNQVNEYEALNKEYLALNENLKESNFRLKEINIQLKDSKNKAEESDRLKSAFLANMSHEIRTPMNAIIGFSSFLTDGSLSEEKRAYFINIIKNSGNRLLKIINDIIDISKLEAKQLKIDMDNCNLCDVFRNCRDEIIQNDLYKNKPNVDFRINIKNDLKNCHLKTDNLRLQQVLLNLITNAFKYTEEGYVETGFTVTNTDESSNILIYVKDTGVGIPQDKKELIFERFRQIEENEYHEGAGLGLSISKGILELLGGKIWFTSTPGEGTTFYFTIPYQRENVIITKAFDEYDEQLNLNGLQIVIAEDDENSYKYLFELLTETNANISYASNGKELMEILKEFVPDLILLDINMPVMNGFECLNEIRSNGIDVKIIAQTAYAMSDERERCFAAGCNGYISKPFSRLEMFRIIKEVLNLTLA